MRRTLLALAAAGLLMACSSGNDFVVSSPFDTAPLDTSAPDAATADPVVTEPVTALECPPEAGTEGVSQSFTTAPPFCLDPAATYTAVVSTSIGDLTIELDQAAAPETVNNFVFLARNNYFDATVCHRVIQNFVVQCGDPTATGMGGPGYAFADELPAAGAYQIGSIAMANSGPDTNGSQFFIISGPDGAQLPPLYSLFGQVVDEDLAVVSDMNALGSTDSSGVPSSEVRINDVTITQS